MKLLYLFGASMLALAAPALAAQSATTVQSGKSNGDAKPGGPVADAPPAEATTITSSKSNSDARSGGAVADAPLAEATSLNSSKSNSSFKIDPYDPDGEKKCVAQGGTVSKADDGIQICTIPGPAAD